MGKNQIITEEHHRRARSLGGKSTPANISYVKSIPHRHYHTLFGNKNANQVCEWLNKYCPFKPEGVKVTCKFVGGTEVDKLGQFCSKKPGKIATAWNSLMKGLDFAQSVEYINNVWLDPSYRLELKEI